MTLDLGLREKLLAPLSKMGRTFLEPMMKDLERICVVDTLIPRLLDHVIESGQRYPEVFKFEGPWTSRSLVIGKQEGAMVGEGR